MSPTVPVAGPVFATPTSAAGTVVTTTKGEVRFETSEVRTLQRGQARIDVPIRAAADFKGDAGKVDAGKITELFQPIGGISRATNFEPTFLGAEDETDEEADAVTAEADSAE